jgi:hypothetical protein
VAITPQALLPQPLAGSLAFRIGHATQ